MNVKNSVRNLMCVGRYAEMMELSEAKWNHFEMPATEMPILCIPAECDTTNRFKQTHITQIMLSHSAGMHIFYAIFAGISLRLCYISLRSFRITFTAYLPTHIKFLTEFRRKPSLGQLVYQFFKLCYTNAASKQLIPSLSSILAMLLKERFSVPESNLLTY